MNFNKIHNMNKDLSAHIHTLQQKKIVAFQNLESYYFAGRSNLIGFLKNLNILNGFSATDRLHLHQGTVARATMCSDDHCFFYFRLGGLRQYVRTRTVLRRAFIYVHPLYFILLQAC